jgi:hypothetical protein
VNRLDELYGIVMLMSPDVLEGRRRFINVLRAIWLEDLPTD